MVAGDIRGMEDAAHDRPRHHVSRNRPEPQQGDGLLRHGHSLGRDGEQRITVERGVDGPDGASVAVLAHHREALQVLVVQHGVGGHHPDRGVGRHPGLHLEWGGWGRSDRPVRRLARYRHMVGLRIVEVRIERRAEWGERGTEAALERRGNCAKAGTGVAKREVRRRQLGRRVRQGPVWRDLAPKLVAVIGQVKDHRTADERDDGAPAGKASALAPNHDVSPATASIP